MEALKQNRNRIIAVDTSLGTNFLVSAFDDETISELREFIQAGHLSCFPEYGSINIQALTVKYSGRQYHVTDSLHVRQIFRKSWNKMHADVSSGALRAQSNLESPKSTEAASLANKSTGNLCAILGDKLLPDSARIKGLDFDRHDDDALNHKEVSPSYEEKMREHLMDTTPILPNSQTSSINREDLRCPLLSVEETPYTQPHSQAQSGTLGVHGKRHLVNEWKERKRKDGTEELMGKKSKQVKVNGQVSNNDGKDEGLERSRKCAVSADGATDAQEYKSFALRDHRCKQDILREQQLNQETGSTEQATEFVEGNEEFPSKNLSFYNMNPADGRVQREHDTQLSGVQSQDGKFEELDTVALSKVDTNKGFTTKISSNCLRQDPMESQNINAVTKYQWCPMESQNINAIKQSCDGEMAAKTFVDLSSINETLAWPSKEKGLLNSKREVSLSPTSLDEKNRGKNVELLYPQIVDCDHQVHESGAQGGIHENLVSPKKRRKKRKKHKKEQLRYALNVPLQDDNRFSVSATKAEDVDGNHSPNRAAEQTADLLGKRAETCRNDKAVQGSALPDNQHHTLLKEVGADFKKIVTQSACDLSLLQKSEKNKGRTASLSKKSAETGNDEKGSGSSAMFGNRMQVHPKSVHAKSMELGIQDSSLCVTDESNHKGPDVEGKDIAVSKSNGSTARLDLPTGSPVQLNNQCTLCEASMSADVVPNTQESEMQSRGYENASPEMPPLNMENSRSENGPEIVRPHHCKHDNQLLGTCFEPGSHSMLIASEKKRRRKRKELNVSKMSADDGKMLVSENNKYKEGTVDTTRDTQQISHSLENRTDTHNHKIGVESCNVQKDQTRSEPGNIHGVPWRQDASPLNADESKNEGSFLSGDELVSQAKVLLELSSLKTSRGSPEGRLKSRPGFMHVDYPCAKEQAIAQVLHKKKKKRRKDHRPTRCEGVMRHNSPNVTIEANPAPFSIKELPNVLRVNASKDSNICQGEKMEPTGREVSKSRSMTEAIEEQKANNRMKLNQDVAAANSIDMEDGSAPFPLVSSPRKVCFQSGILQTKPSVDVFNYESSETTDQLNKGSSDFEQASTSEASALDKISSAAVELVENHILNSEMTIRKSGRKSIHPKRWIEVLTERLNAKQMAKKSSKKQRGTKRDKAGTEGDAESKEENNRSAIDGVVFCRIGCGRLYAKKTSAYYRHCRMCTGKRLTY